MTSSLKVTAIIPTFNRSQYLHESIMAVLQQTRPPDEVIVVDDGSTDGTGELLSSFGDRIRTLKKGNGGKSSALNLALSLARGDAIWIMDDDDIAVAYGLEVLETALASQPEVGFIFGGYDNFFTEGQAVNYAPAPSCNFDIESLYFSGLLEFFAFQPATLVRKHCFDFVGKFDENMPRAQDYDMLLRLSAQFRASFVNKVIFHQRQHSGARGPAHARVDGARVWELQGQHDRICIAKSIKQQPLEAFTPWNRRQISASPAEQVRALLRRSVVKIIRVNDPDGAADDIAAAAAVAHEHASGDDAALVPTIIQHAAYGLGLHESAQFSSLISAAETAPKRIRNALLRPLLIGRLRRIAGAIRRREIHSANEITASLKNIGTIALKARMLI